MVAGQDHQPRPNGARLRGFSTVGHTKVSVATRSGYLAMKPCTSARLRPAKWAPCDAEMIQKLREARLDRRMLDGCGGCYDRSP
jgi:hypothetical protein